MLPSSQITLTRRRPDFPPTPATDAQTPLMQPVHELGPLTLNPVTSIACSCLWNKYIARYHYLGYSPMSGGQMRYNVFADEQLVALLSFRASACKLNTFRQLRLHRALVTRNAHPKPARWARHRRLNLTLAAAARLALAAKQALAQISDLKMRRLQLRAQRRLAMPSLVRELAHCLLVEQLSRNRQLRRPAKFVLTTPFAPLGTFRRLAVQALAGIGLHHRLNVFLLRQRDVHGGERHCRLATHRRDRILGKRDRIHAAER